MSELKDKIVKNAGKINIAAYSALIIAGVGGYTNLVKDLGSLEATVEYQQKDISRQSLAIDNATDVYARLNKDYKELLNKCMRIEK